jgi:hypothetical protein
LEEKRNYAQAYQRFALADEQPRGVGISDIRPDMIICDDIEELPTIKKSKGTKHMPQVIYNCDVGSAEKVIFQAVADSTKRDIYVYNMGGKYANPSPDNTSDSYHFYFYCDRAGTNSDNAPGMIADKINHNKDPYPFSYENISYKVPLPAVKGYISHWHQNTMFNAHDLLTPLEENDELRILALMCWAFNKCSTYNFTFDKSISNFLLKINLSKASKILEQNRTRDIDAKQRSITQSERDLSAMYNALQSLLSTSYSSQELNTDMIDNILKLPEVVSASINIIDGESHVIIVTEPLIVHLPHGDIPAGSITIKIRWKEQPTVSIKGQYMDSCYHPHYNSNACWGGFAPMVTKLLATCNFDVLIDIILKWFGAYDATGTYELWQGRLAYKEIGMIINEAHYMSGEDDE